MAIPFLAKDILVRNNVYKPPQHSFDYVYTLLLGRALVSIILTEATIQDARSNLVKQSSTRQLFMSL